MKNSAFEIWNGCYDDSWKGHITDASFAHPAKASRALLLRIFAKLAEMGLERGQTVLDCFGGIGTTGIVGASLGYRVVCSELEPRFVDMAKANFELHRRTWEAFGDPLPVMLQGDSRKLCGVLADACVSSPPFLSGIDSDVRGEKLLVEASKAHRHKRRIKDGSAKDYGQTPGQLGSMPSGSLDAAVSSPPYEGSLDCGPNECTRLADLKGQAVKYSTMGTVNIGNATGKTFWTAARDILLQCHQLLKPGGMTAWIVKDYCRDGKRVAFCDDWARLLEHCGFTVELRVRAMLTKETVEAGLFGTMKTKKERKSFFRRLYERKLPEGDERRIDHEEVIFAVRGIS